MVSFALAVPLLALIDGFAAPAGAAPPNNQVQVNVSQDGPTTSTGEPTVSVNPTNPNNLYIAYGRFPIPSQPAPPLPTLIQAPAAHSCGGYLSMDAGQSWQFSPLPFTPQANPFFPNDPTQETFSSECEDGISAFGPDGTVYAGGDSDIGEQVVGPEVNGQCPANSAASAGTGGFCIRLPGDDVLARSTDGGRTWTQLPDPIGSHGYGLALNFGGSNFRSEFDFASGHPVDTWDRPFMAVDQSTGYIYFTSANFLDRERFLTVSTDKGSSWGSIYPIDSPTYPGNGPAWNVDAAHGVVAIAYTASPAPGGCAAACLIFETSTDFGATWNRHIVPLENATPSSVTPGVAADPVGRGQFALTVVDSTGTENQVYITRDFGQTWQGPTDVAEAGTNQQYKSWLSYGPSGQLVLMWKSAQVSEGTYNVWAAVGRDRGANGPVFSAPVSAGPTLSAYPVGSEDDDRSSVAASNQYVYVGWGNSLNLPTAGGQSVSVTRIPITVFSG